VARARKQKQVSEPTGEGNPDQTGTQTGQDSEVITKVVPKVITTDTGERKTIMALSPEQIRAVYAKRRTKGLYTDLIAEFLAMEEGGVSVKEQWNAQLGEKKVTSLKQGFDNVKKSKGAPDGAELVDVIVDGDDVYLINKALVGSEAVAA
jgi:hypothetical protein